MRVKFFKSIKPMTPLHGPQLWPLWRWISFGGSDTIRPNRHELYRRMWIYTRWGAFLIEMKFNT